MNFSIHFFDLLIYLLPGTMVTGVVFYCLGVYLHWHDIIPSIFSQGWFLATFLILSYMIGHILYEFSVVVSKIDYRLCGKRTMTQRAIEETSFFQDLEDKLKRYLNKKELSPQEVTPFCMRMVAEKMPVSNQTIDRMLAVMLFSRSMVTSLSIIIIALGITLILTLSGVFVLTIIPSAVAIYFFFIRYRSQYRAYLITCWRSVYLWLIENRQTQ